MEKEQKEKNEGLNIELTEDVAQGTYANLAVITHSSTEFVVDFVNVMPGMQRSRVHSRIITNPIHAKRLLRALEDNIKRYEENFGAIQENEKIEFPLNLGGATMQA